MPSWETEDTDTPVAFVAFALRRDDLVSDADFCGVGHHHTERNSSERQRFVVGSDGGGVTRQEPSTSFCCSLSLSPLPLSLCLSALAST